MAIDLNLILRKWAFDLESEALGAIRIANADLEKKLQGKRDRDPSR